MFCNVVVPGVRVIDPHYAPIMGPGQFSTQRVDDLVLPIRQ
jgi:hypothetical protein